MSWGKNIDFERMSSWIHNIKILYLCIGKNCFKEFIINLSMKSTSSYLLSDLNNLRVSLDMKRLIDENGVLKNQITQTSTNEIYFVFELITHNEVYSPKKYSKIYPKKL